jgi:predicted NUDIX family NTP pyrophosphohydrolase
MKKSAGILLYREHKKELQFLLIHPGGPFWKNKDEGAWSIPKGEPDNDEEALAAALRELKEETGFEVSGDFIELTPVKMRSGKIIEAWALAGDPDLSAFHSNEFEMEWPPRSGKRLLFPEADKAEWFNLSTALQKINPAQQALLMEMAELHQSLK